MSTPSTNPITEFPQGTIKPNPNTNHKPGQPAGQPATTTEELARGRDYDSPAAKQFWRQSWARNVHLYEHSLLEAVRAEREQNGRCPKCHAHVPVRYPDTRARTDAVKALHELAALRPRPEDEDAGTVHLTRTVD